MAKISITDLAGVIAKQRTLSTKDVEKFISAMFLVVDKGLDADRLVKIKGLGTFKVTSVKPRESINVNTGARVVIEGHDKVSFTPDTSMRDLINKPFAQFETVVLKDDVDFSDIEHDNSDEEKRESVASNTEKEVQKEKTISSNEEEIAPQDMVQENVLEIKDDKEDSPVTAPADNIVVSGEDGNPNDVIERRESSTITSNTNTYERGENVMVEQANVDKEEFVDTQEWVSRSQYKHSIIIGVLSAVICLFIGLLVGIYILGDFNHDKVAKSEFATPQVTMADKDSMTNAKVNPAPGIKTSANKTEDEVDFDKMNADPRVKMGAYNIVGIDTIITLKSGQTMKSYCRSTLGSGMLCYFQVLNDTTELGEGAKMKVPKVKVK
ncbi:MAG: HU family DNA-binding protein [Prevotella sp.]|nr:HU family DNA-binding protein [Prevotella sp.]